MKKIILLFIIIAFIQKNNAQTEVFSYENKTITDLLSTFIDSYKSGGNDYYNYSVYVIFVHKPIDPNSNDTCFTIEVIENESFYDYVKPQYYCYFKDEIVLFRFDHKIDYYEELNLKPIKINIGAKKKAIGKLLPSKDGYVTGTYLGYLIFKNGFNTKLKIFENSDYIPKFNKAIQFPDFSDAELIKPGKKDRIKDLK